MQYTLLGQSHGRWSKATEARTATIVGRCPAPFLSYLRVQRDVRNPARHTARRELRPWSEGSRRRNIFRKLIFLERPQPRVAGRGGIRRRGCAGSCRCAAGARPATAAAAGEEWTEVERGVGVGMGWI